MKRNLFLLFVLLLSFNAGKKQEYTIPFYTLRFSEPAAFIRIADALQPDHFTAMQNLLPLLAHSLCVESTSLSQSCEALCFHAISKCQLPEPPAALCCIPPASKTTVSVDSFLRLQLSFNIPNIALRYL